LPTTSQVESLAGIMGGDATAVSDDTRHIYIEAAFWWPKAVAGRSRRYNFSTDAGHRFERGVDPSLTVEHIERITQLIIDICGTPETLCGPVDDQQCNLPQPKPCTLRVARAAKVIGMPLTQEQCAGRAERLGLPVCGVRAIPGNAHGDVTPPPTALTLRSRKT
jgi:phenylalanyl-tRNA synthetase beta chain